METMLCNKRVVVVAVLMLSALLAACVAPMPAMPEAAMEQTAPQPEPSKVTVAMVRARPAPMLGGNTGAFLTVLNGTDSPVQFVSAAGDVSEVVELHETVDENGVMKMIPHPEGFEVPAGGSLEMKPGGKHVMLIGVTQMLAPGDAFSLTLTFDGADPITVSVPVVEMQDAAMGGMGDMPAGGETKP
jgi:hypothetical protein